MRAMGIRSHQMAGRMGFSSMGGRLLYCLWILILTSFSKRTHSDDAEGRNEVVWGQIEDNFQHTKADVLEIFDW